MPDNSLVRPRGLHLQPPTSSSYCNLTLFVLYREYQAILLCAQDKKVFKVPTYLPDAKIFREEGATEAKPWHEQVLYDVYNTTSTGYQTNYSVFMSYRGVL